MKVTGGGGGRGGGVVRNFERNPSKVSKCPFMGVSHLFSPLKSINSNKATSNSSSISVLLNTRKGTNLPPSVVTFV